MTLMFSKSQEQLTALRSASFPSSPVHLQGHLPPCSSSPIANLEVSVSFLLPSLSWRPPNMGINSTLLEMVPCYKIHVLCQSEIGHLFGSGVQPYLSQGAPGKLCYPNPPTLAYLRPSLPGWLRSLLSFCPIGTKCQYSKIWAIRHISSSSLFRLSQHWGLGS